MFKDERTSDFPAICRAIGYQFRSKQEGVQVAWVDDNQSLEFIGDKVIGFAISNYLFKKNPKWKEGQLTEATSELVKNKGPLFKVARYLKLGEYLITGKSERAQVEYGHEKILADSVEALYGAIFLDCGENHQVTSALVLRHWAAAGLINNEDLVASKEANLLPPLKRLDPLEVNSILGRLCPSFFRLVLRIDQKGVDQLDKALLNLLDPDRGEIELKALETLLQAGANPNAAKEVLEEYSLGNEVLIGNGRLHSALQLAVMHLNPSLVAVKLLLDFGADANWNGTTVKQDSCPGMFGSFPETNKMKSRVTSTKKTALHLIVEHDLNDQNEAELCHIVNLLLSRSADPLKTDYEGLTPHAILLSRIREEKTSRSVAKKIDNLTRILKEAVQKQIELETRVEEHKGALCELTIGL
jgi:hypothetical protein